MSIENKRAEDQYQTMARELADANAEVLRLRKGAGNAEYQLEQREQTIRELRDHLTHARETNQNLAIERDNLRTQVGVLKARAEDLKRKLQSAERLESGQASRISNLVNTLRKERYQREADEHRIKELNLSIEALRTENRELVEKHNTRQGNTTHPGETGILRDNFWRLERENRKLKSELDKSKHLLNRLQLKWNNPPVIHESGPLPYAAFGEEEITMKNVREEAKGPYHTLRCVLDEALKQASQGKGKIRHAKDQPFHKQRMQKVSELLDSNRGMAYQAVKKISEGLDLEAGPREQELLGAINYIAGIIIYNRERDFPPSGADGETKAD